MGSSSGSLILVRSIAAAICHSSCAIMISKSLIIVPSEATLVSFSLLLAAHCLAAPGGRALRRRKAFRSAIVTERHRVPIHLSHQLSWLSASSGPYGAGYASAAETQTNDGHLLTSCGVLRWDWRFSSSGPLTRPVEKSRTSRQESSKQFLAIHGHLSSTSTTSIATFRPTPSRFTLS